LQQRNRNQILLTLPTRSRLACLELRAYIIGNRSKSNKGKVEVEAVQSHATTQPKTRAPS
jgi:hypothetical protein